MGSRPPRGRSRCASPAMPARRFVRSGFLSPPRSSRFAGRWPNSLACCGLPAIDCGAVEAARTMARQTIETLEAARADWIVTAAASCAIAVGHDYLDLFRDEPGWRARAEALAARMVDLVTFLDRVASL